MTDPDRDYWNCLVPESTRYAVDKIGVIIVQLCQLALELRGCERQVADDVSVYYFYEAKGDSLDPCGLFPMGTETVQCECQWESFTLAEDLRVISIKAWHIAKAMIEQGRFYHPACRWLSGVGLQIKIGGEELMLLHRCHWDGTSDSKQTRW